MAFQQARPYDTGADALGTMGDIQRLVAGQRQNRLGDLQFQLEQQKHERATRAYEAQQALLGQIKDPRERLAATMAPDKFAGSIFRDPKDNFIPDGSGGLWDLRGPDGKPVKLGGDPGWRPMTGGAPGGAPPAQTPGANLAAAGTGFRRAAGSTMPDRPPPAIFNDQIQAHAARNGFDARILSNLVTQESGGDHSAVSAKGAKGITQIMPNTAGDPGFGVTPLQNGTWEEALRFGADYLGALNKHYIKQGKDPESAMNLALGAYNWGVGNVDAWLKAGGDLSKVPPETMGYIQNIIGPLQTGRTAGAPPAPGGHGPGQTDKTPPLTPLINGKGEINNDFGVDAQGNYWPWPGKGTTVNVDTGAKKGSETLVKARADRLAVLREKGLAAIDLKPKLLTLREQLMALKTQGPGSGTVLRALGIAQTVARAFGMDQATVHQYTEALTGMKGDDPETAAKANKIVSDLVTVGLRSAYAGLGSASNMEREGIERAQANTENPIGANLYLLDSILIPGMERDEALWERIMPLQEDPELTKLDPTELAFRREWSQKHKAPAPDQQASGAATDTVPNPVQTNNAPPATTPNYTPEMIQAIQSKHPNARQAPDGFYYDPNPNFRPGEPISATNPKYFQIVNP